MTEQYNHGPQAETLAEAVRDVGKWLNERPNRPLDLRHVAMMCAALQETAECQHYWSERGRPLIGVIKNTCNRHRPITKGTP